MEQLRAGGKRAMALALALIEAAPDEPATPALLDAAYRDARAQVIGLTGPPGVGKSTLIARLIEALRAEGRSVGVIAIDPSSRQSGGALLGDRVRLALADDPGVYVRSMAARGRLGGLAPEAYAAAVLMRAVYDVVIVETVGVGQSETDVATVADTIVLCIQPGSGDSLQYVKAGIAEIPDIAVIGKADLGSVALKAQSDLEAALALQRRAADWSVPVIPISGTRGYGIQRLVQAIADHEGHLAIGGRLVARRQAQAERWAAETLRSELGRRGLEQAERAGALRLAPGEAPFGALHRLLATPLAPAPQ
ncbi:MAG TPA: methylmalonyl Co-A mutase-associated GTPase MeaB [Geminicoccaceae bacterium]|nr:methylmalonyl Co-A mutase-associated GTPase MeaB [Geminicoccaceae bacterium]